MCYNLNGECHDLGCAQNATGAEGKGAPPDHPGHWMDGDITHLNWGSRRRRSLGEKVMSLGAGLLFEVLVRHPNQDVPEAV